MRTGILLLVMALAPSPAMGRASCPRVPCACAGRLSPSNPEFADQVRKERDGSAAVFLGTVRRIAEDSQYAFAEFRVSKAWKGVRDTLVRIDLRPATKTTTRTDSAGNTVFSVTWITSDCDMSVKVGDEWLIVAYRDSAGSIQASKCSSDRPDRARAVVSVLDSLARGRSREMAHGRSFSLRGVRGG